MDSDGEAVRRLQDFIHKDFDTTAKIHLYSAAGRPKFEVVVYSNKDCFVKRGDTLPQAVDAVLKQWEERE